MQLIPRLATYWRSMLAWFVVCVGIAVIVVAVSPKKYSSTSAVMISVVTKGSAGDLQQGAAYAQQQMASYVELATSDAILAPVASSSDLSTTSSALAGQVSVSVPTGTSVLEVQAEDGDPGRARTIVSAVAKQLSKSIEAGSPASTTGAGSSVRAQIITPAADATKVSPNAKVDILIGMVLGLVAALEQAVLRSRRVRSSVPMVPTTTKDEGAHDIVVPARSRG